ncbi:MAG: hypothetical protein Q4C78_03440 [Synergistaceae bacterium]|nr:hypothetical protein [Synergistaceae bacterium]
MSCFIVPVTEAIVTTVAEKVMKSKEKKQIVKLFLSDGSMTEATKISFATKLGWLNKMLWGGSALLAFEHLWHGEVTPFFPFLTAIESGNSASMFAEMGSVGVMMSVLVTFVWGCMVAVSSIIEKRNLNSTKLLRERA